MGRLLSAGEFAEYIALLNVDPWGPFRGDMQAATAAYGSACVWTSEVSVSDFLLPWGEIPDEELTPEERMERFKERLKKQKGK